MRTLLKKVSERNKAFLPSILKTNRAYELSIRQRQANNNSFVIPFKMPERVDLKGYEAFKSSIEEYSGKKEINVYFSGSKNDKGVSWCSDCVSAQPHVMAAVDKYARKESVFMYVDVGDRSFWKDMKNPFRLDKDIHIQVIPTLIRWKAHQRLEGDQLKKDDLLEMFFTETD